MKVFVDFEASSLGRESYPIAVGWVWEDGRSEEHLIRPAPGWDDWDMAAQAIHRIPRDRIERDGAAVATVAARMIDALSGHDLLASAPSWDGKWLSRLLRGAGRPRHALRLRDTETAWAEAVTAHPDGAAVIARAKAAAAHWPVTHRAVEDAARERRFWLLVREIAGSGCGETPPP